MATLAAAYVDLDGTMLGRGGSLIHDAQGKFSLAAVRALEACWRVQAEVVIKSGRRRLQVESLARLIGQHSYICEVGALLVDHGEEVWLTGDLKPTAEHNLFEQIDQMGAPELLLRTYGGLLEHHAPWHTKRDVSHLFRGQVDVERANRLLAEHGFGQLKLIDNGATTRRSVELKVERPRIYHLLPKAVSKQQAVLTHMTRRGLKPDQCIAVGDSAEDLTVAEVVGRFFLVANALEDEPELEKVAGRYGNVEITEARMGEGFYEAVVRTLAR